MFFQEFETHKTLLLSQGPGDKWHRVQSSILKASDLRAICAISEKIGFSPLPPTLVFAALQRFRVQGFGALNKTNQTIPNLPLVFAIAPVELE